MAICTLASVPFLNLTGIERPDASSRWTWLSVVRAPMAPHVTRPIPSCAAYPDRAAPLSAPLRHPYTADDRLPTIGRRRAPMSTASAARPPAPQTKNAMLSLQRSATAPIRNAAIGKHPPWISV